MAKRKPTPLSDDAPSGKNAPSSSASETYTVLARRYRPQQFQDIVGQVPVARALKNALESNRVAHAYLFTGARGVGKTSTARILAKALNCVKGPTATPCDQCERCLSIAGGEDVDVLEIDGASNRGIDEIREIRQNVQYRPSRSRFKIYIIDEVHMLTKEAFNALLKTLEEPPPHVKFIFATTEAQKIPVTILSRCQRFDFAGIGTARIVDRLRAIVADEKMKADDDALELIARRAAGSMRDAQSLLDQLLAFGDDRLTAEHVYRLLGTAHVDRVMELAKAILERDSKEALELLGRSVDEGLQLSELLDQLIEYWRDMMVLNCAGTEVGDISVPSRHRDTLILQAKTASLDTILAGLDVLGTTKARLRGSNHGRVLMEMAVVRLSRLDDLVSLSQLTHWLNPSEGRESKSQDRGQRIENRESTIRATKVGKDIPKAEEQKISQLEARSEGANAGALTSISNAPSSPPESAASPGAGELTETSLPTIWGAVLGELGPMLAGNLGKADRIAISGPKTLVLHFPSRYNHERDYCDESTRISRIQDAIQKITGQTWNVRVESGAGNEVGPQGKQVTTEPVTSNYRRQRAEAGQEPLVKRALDQLAAQIVQVEDGFGASKSEPLEQLETANIEET
jgi:DNA polymerase-3 subunit gamma/tau